MTKSNKTGSKTNDPCADGCKFGCSHDRNTKAYPKHTAGPWRTGTCLKQDNWAECPIPAHTRAAIAKAEGK